MERQLVLVIDAEETVRSSLTAHIAAHGYFVYGAATGQQGLRLLARLDPAVVIVDSVSTGDAICELCRQIQQQSVAPVIAIIPPRPCEVRIRLLKAGATVCLARPISLPELVAQLAAIQRQSLAPQRGPSAPTLTIGDLTIDPARRRAARWGAPIDLSPIEWRILELLAEHPGWVCTHNMLCAAIWGTEPDDPHCASLHTFVYTLRKKLQQPGQPPLIETLRGVGYRLHWPAEGGAQPH